MLAALLYASFYINAQEDTLSEKTLGEVVVSANKFSERKRNINQKIDIITARAIANTNAQNTGDLLINTGNVFVQKSQQGGSSPVVRGFEASRQTQRVATSPPVVGGLANRPQARHRRAHL